MHSARHNKIVSRVGRSHDCRRPESAFGHRRSAGVLVILAITLPMLVGIAGLVLDTSILFAAQRNLQSASDAAATAAAMTIYQGGSVADATAIATTAVQNDNSLPDATVAVNIPPTSGPYAGNAGYVQVVATRKASTFFIQVLGGSSAQTIETSSTAGAQSSTAAGVVCLLDPNPPGITVDLAPVAPLALTLPPILGGLQVLGLGQLQVNGAILDNNQWGGVDQNGNPAGTAPAPPYAASCTPLVSLTSVAAQNIRVVGGVDNPHNFGSITPGQPSPLRCNALPVPDPFSSVPAPTTAADSKNVVATNYGGVSVVGLPLLPAKVLNPGVYDWIEIVSGDVVFNPGVYIIRNVNPVTQIALNVIAGTVTANGVTFYITNTTNYSPASGAPDNSDGNAVPPAGAPNLFPSVVLASLLGSNYSGLNDSSSPFNGLLIYQRRIDRRPIVLADETLILGGALSGSVYSKYGQAIFAANGTFTLQFVTGSLLCLNALQCKLTPAAQPLPPAMDVYLVQ
ncbi:MAG TPA: pilus assembly protein TadG-related protein [Planctomycetaceae bacterium]|nr:pilus assembly protein TadG-related protein [Planctomycetaceae bacterium]